MLRHRFLLLLVFLCTVSSSVFATLGENLASVERDRKTWGASTANQSTNNGITRSEIKTEGNVVTEYSDSNGTIFLIRWTGTLPPDLSTLLGSYYAEYQAAVPPRQTGGRTDLLVKTASLEVLLGGRMRSLRGRAVLVPSVPAGIDLESLP